MHHVLKYPFVLFLLLILYCACRKDPQNPALTEADYPRILGTWTKEANVYEGDTVEYDIQFSPADLCKASWKINGVEVWAKPRYRFGCPPVTQKDTLQLYLEVRNGNQVNSRSGIIILNPKP
jgi:hypothetical protein